MIRMMIRTTRTKKYRDVYNSYNDDDDVMTIRVTRIKVPKPTQHYDDDDDDDDVPIRLIFFLTIMMIKMIMIMMAMYTQAFSFFYNDDGGNGDDDEYSVPRHMQLYDGEAKDEDNDDNDNVPTLISTFPLLTMRVSEVSTHAVTCISGNTCGGPRHLPGRVAFSC